MLFILNQENKILQTNMEENLQKYCITLFIFPQIHILHILMHISIFDFFRRIFALILQVFCHIYSFSALLLPFLFFIVFFCVSFYVNHIACYISFFVLFVDNFVYHNIPFFVRMTICIFIGKYRQHKSEKKT